MPIVVNYLWYYVFKIKVFENSNYFLYHDHRQQNGYINYRQAFFTNLENTFSFLTLTAKIRQYKYDNNNKNYNEMVCPNDQSPFETL
jgi:hypothetical protein